jgi:hypothetical protein
VPGDHNVISQPYGMKSKRLGTLTKCPECFGSGCRTEDRMRENAPESHCHLMPPGLSNR